MRPEIQRLVDDLASVREAVAAVGDVSRPASNGWTVGQVLDHLAKANEAMVPRFAAALATAPDLSGVERVRYSFFDRQVVKAMSGKSISIPVPPMFEPAMAGVDGKEACLASLDAMLEILHRADGKALSGIRVASPISARIRLGLLPYMDAIVGHAVYHRGQI